MRRVIIDIDEKYSDLISLTAIGHKKKGSSVETNMTAGCFDLEKGAHIIITERAEKYQFMEGVI